MNEASGGDGRLIELGRLRIHLWREEDAVAMLQSLVRPLSNQEVAVILGVSERTVRRWKRSGKLPSRRRARLRLSDLLLLLERAAKTIP